MHFFQDGHQDGLRNLILAITQQLFTQTWWSLHLNLGFWGQGTRLDGEKQHWTIILHDKHNMALNMATNTWIKQTFHSDFAVFVSFSILLGKRAKENQIEYILYILKFYRNRCPRKASFFQDGHQDGFKTALSNGNNFVTVLSISLIFASKPKFLRQGTHLDDD